MQEDFCLGSEHTPANLLNYKNLKVNFDLSNTLQKPQSCKATKWRV